MVHDYIPSSDTKETHDYFNIILKNTKMQKCRKNWRGNSNILNIKFPKHKSFENTFNIQI